MPILFTALIVLAAAGITPLLAPRRAFLARIVSMALTVAGCALGLTAVLMIAWHGQPASFSCSWLRVFTLSFSLDGLTGLFLAPVFVVSPCIALYSVHYLDCAKGGWRVSISMAMFNLLVVAMTLVTLADNMVTFALAWELMSVSSYFLVLYDYDKEENRQAGIFYLLFTQTGALFLFAAFGVIYAATGTLDFAGMAQLPPHLKMTVFFLTLIGFGSKAGVFPLHIWLPHAHPAAPSHVSALLSGVMIKMGIYGILRFYFLLDTPSPIPAWTIITLGMVSGILGVVYALGKHDLKRLLAYHSIENIGIILLGCGLGMLGLHSGDRIMAVFGFTGGILHVFNHAIFKSLLFMGAGAVVQKTGMRHIDQLGGLMKTMPVTGRTFLTGSIAISGLPPLNGFVSEFFIYYAAFLGLTHNGGIFPFAMASIVALSLIGGLAAACFTKVVGIVFLGEPRTPQGSHCTDAGFAMRAAMIMLALACLLIGLWPQPLIYAVCSSLQTFKPLAGISPDIFGPVPGYLAMAARLLVGLLLIVTLLRRLLYHGKTISLTGTWGCGFTRPTARIQYTGTSYAMSLVEFFRPFVRVKTQFSGLSNVFPDRTTYGSKVADVAETGLNRLVIHPLFHILGKLRWIQHGYIQLYIAYIILTIAVLLLVS